MDYLAGETLYEYIDRNHPLTQDDIDKVIYPLLRGVAHLHRYGVYDIDLKLTNIYLSEGVEDLLIYFGLSNIDEVTSGGVERDISALLATAYALISGDRDSIGSPKFKFPIVRRGVSKGFIRAVRREIEAGVAE